MKRFALLGFLFAVGCGATEPSPEPAPAAPGPAAGKTKEERIAEIRSRIELKRNELRQADIDLGKVTAERFELEAKPASEAKTNRMTELAKIESDTKVKKQAIEAEIADLERQAQEAAGAPKPKSADEALDLALEAEARKQKEEAERRKVKAEADAAAEKRRLEDAEKARAAELAAQQKEKEKVRVAPPPAAPAGGEGLTFEERYADVILKVRAELQRFKRW